MESQEDALSASLPVKPLNSIWDCEHLCIVMQENEFGKTVSGWTCAYCPRSGNVGGYIFRKTVNATKALCHVLKLRGNAVGTCKGTIPYSKKRAYKALYNVNRIKIKDKQGRDAALRGEIVEFQDKSLSAHFPAVSGTSQRKQPRHQESDTGGPFPLILLPLFG